MITSRCHREVRRATTAVGLVLLLPGLAACGSSDAGPSSATTTTRRPAASSSTTSAGGASTTTAEASTSTAGGATTTSASPGGGRLDGASEEPRSAPADGTGTALLTGVRVGVNEGFERIVFEFEGDAHPGYRVRWVDGPILADASGEEVAVEGDAYLEMIMQPASGVDMEDGSVVYRGSDRIPVAGRTAVLTDLVRTGDFEAVLSWVAGATERVPFRVLSLSSPTRLVVDLEAS